MFVLLILHFIIETKIIKTLEKFDTILEKLKGENSIPLF